VIATLGGWIFDGLRSAAAMIWMTLCSLVLGFALAGAVQAFVRRGEIRLRLGERGAPVIENRDERRP
jgi:hypothetical protein